MDISTLPDGSHETRTLCGVCGRETPWRQPPGGVWFCSVCGTHEVDDDGAGPVRLLQVSARRLVAIFGAICITVAGILWVGIALSSRHSSPNAVAAQPTQTATSIPQSTPTAAPPTPTPADANLPPAQQLAYTQLGHVVSPKRAIVGGFTRDLNAIQTICGQHQFQIQATLVDLWHRIHALGKHDTLAQVSRGYTQEMQDYIGSGAGQIDCAGEADVYLQMRYLNRTMAMVYAQESETPTPVPPTPTDIPTDTPIPTATNLVMDQYTYKMVNDHPDLYKGDLLLWECVIAKFLGTDANGNTTIGCWEFNATYDGATGDGEVALTVPSFIDTSHMDTGDALTVEGTVAQPFTGTNAYGAAITVPDLSVSAINDEGPWQSASVS